jgi:hypothetical protein
MQFSDFVCRILTPRRCGKGLWPVRGLYYLRFQGGKFNSISKIFWVCYVILSHCLFFSETLLVVEVDRKFCFWTTYILGIGLCLLIVLMMEVASTSETLVNFYQTTRRNKPEDSHLRTHHRENLKSYLGLFFILFFQYYSYIPPCVHSRGSL